MMKKGKRTYIIDLRVLNFECDQRRIRYRCVLNTLEIQQRPVLLVMCRPELDEEIQSKPVKHIGYFNEFFNCSPNSSGKVLILQVLFLKALFYHATKVWSSNFCRI